MEKKIHLYPINGKNQNIDYVQFEKSIESVFAKHNDSCKSAKFFIFNNFPIVLSTKISVDLLLVIAIENTTGNFYIVKNSEEGNPIYFHNQIIPITIITDYENSNPYLCEDGIIRTANEDIDYSDEIKEIGKGLHSYLQNKVGLKGNIFVNPLIFIKNNRNKIICDNYLVAPNLDFESLNEYFWKNKQYIFNSYDDWKLSYDSIQFDIRKIIDQASKDSKYGYLTKKKIELLSKQYNNVPKLRYEVGEYLVSIKGKAGTGKSSLLLSIAQKTLKNNRNVLFLTYNKLLTYDISILSKAIKNKTKEISKAQFTVQTLHSFFYHLSKTLKINLLMNEYRHSELLQKLQKRVDKIYPILLNNWDSPYENKLTYIQNHPLLDKKEKDEAIELLKWSKDRIEKEKYIKYKSNLIGEFLNKNTFLNDYENILKNLREAVFHTNDFYEKFDIKNKAHHFSSSKYIKNNEVTEKGFQELLNRSIGNRKKNRIVLIDEAQDCHPFEKEILIHIFKANNIVIANGGKEQLIRYKELCNWNIFKGQKIETKLHTLKGKSFRTKRAIIDFCNFVAKKAGIDLVLIPMDSEDEGEIIFDFRLNPDVVNLFGELQEKGTINQCRPYESILTLVEPTSEIPSFDESSQTTIQTKNIKINENNVIEYSEKAERKGDWTYLSTLEDNGFLCYNGTKSKELITSFDNIRIIHYESCRGLEAWSVCCFGLDLFFKGKFQDEDAEKYLLDTLYDDFSMPLDAEKRKKIYATNWLLMSLTRAMDTLYIKIENENSYLGQIIKEYISINKDNKNIRVFEFVNIFQ